MLNKLSRSEAEEQTRKLLQQAGFSTPTSLQERMVPLLFQGRDLFIETYGSRGKTLTICIAALLRPVYSPGSTRTLIITSRQKDIERLNRQFTGLPAKNRTIAPLGIEKNPKKELKFISQKPDIIIGTTERIIDHLRRDNIDLSPVELLLISVNEADGQEGLIQDLLFILSKISNLQQRVVFSAVPSAVSPFTEHLHRPNILKLDDWNEQNISHIAYKVEDPKEKPEALRTLYFMNRLDNSLVIARNNSQAQSLEKKLGEQGIPCKALMHEGDVKKAGGGRGINIASFKTADALSSLPFSTVVFYQIPATTQPYARVMSRVAGPEGQSTIITLTAGKERNLLESIKEEHKVEVKENNLPEQKEAITRKQIEEIMKMIKEEENPEVLDNYKQVYKKHVPLSMRRYFTAFLLKNWVQGPSEKSHTTLFVSVGKNKKVFPKDLSRLFSGALKIDPSDIGQIKILESYSFVDIPSDKAQQAIDTLNGSEFRSRKMTVNFARKKEEKS